LNQHFQAGGKTFSIGPFKKLDPAGDRYLGDTWITILAHILDESGAVAAPKGPGRKLAEHIVAIVAMASRPEMVPP
jgi:hypothetical protein